MLLSVSASDTEPLLFGAFLLFCVVCDARGEVESPQLQGTARVLGPACLWGPFTSKCSQWSDTRIVGSVGGQALLPETLINVMESHQRARI